MPGKTVETEAGPDQTAGRAQPTDNQEIALGSYELFQRAPLLKKTSVSVQGV
jgi:hypothetical protein